MSNKTLKNNQKLIEQEPLYTLFSATKAVVEGKNKEAKEYLSNCIKSSYYPEIWNQPTNQQEFEAAISMVNINNWEKLYALQILSYIIETYSQNEKDDKVIDLLKQFYDAKLYQQIADDGVEKII